MNTLSVSKSASEAENNEVISLLEDSVRDFCTRSLSFERLSTLRDKQQSFDSSIWRDMAELGWLATPLDEAQGGLSLGAAGVAVIAKALGEVAAPEPFIETAVTALQILLTSGADEKIIAQLAQGELICAVALGEVMANPFLGTTAREKDGVAQLSGTFYAVALGSEVDAWLIPANIDGIPTWCLVRADAKGIEIVKKPLSDGSVDASLILDACEGAVLARGDIASEAWHRAWQCSLLAASNYQLGLAQTLLNTTVEYVQTREQFGKPIGSFQSLQHRLVDMYLDWRLAEATVVECCSKFDTASLSEPHLGSRAMHRSGLALSAIAREAIQLHGAIGYTDECNISHYANRALVLGARYGRPALHANTIAQAKTAIVKIAQKAASEDASLAELKPQDGDWNALDNDTFRQVIRQWHSAHYPSALKNLRYRVRWDQCRDWYQKLYERGFAAPGWPVEHGGMGLSPEKLLIFIEERERLGIVRTPDQGIIMVGPLLMKHGSPEQMAHYLPKALSGEHIWCQGYSEPNAGSDLASLRTSAVRDGDEFVINGQKIWTTMAQDANQMFCLVRTDPHAKPQAGISFVLIDFQSPGITVRPITNMAGDEEFCEVFFDDVRVPCSNLVGEINQGWTIAKNLLGFERFFIGSPKLCRNALGRVSELALARSLARDPMTVARFTDFELDVLALETLYKSFADQIRRGEIPGADISLLKIFASETFQKLSEFILDLGGAQAMQVDGVESVDGALDALFPYYHARPTTIYGGSNEIQRNIIAKFVLNLPPG